LNVQESSPDVETSAGLPLILSGPSLLPSDRPLVSNVSPFFLALCPVTFNLLHILLHPCRRLLTGSTQELLRLQRPSVPTVVSIPNQRAEKHAHDQVGSTTGGPWAATSPWIQHFMSPSWCLEFWLLDFWKICTTV